MQAEYLGVVEDKVVLKKQNGNIIRVPLSKMSAADVEYLKQLRQQPEPATSQPQTPAPPKPNVIQTADSKSGSDVPSETSPDSAVPSVAKESVEVDPNAQSPEQKLTDAAPIEVPIIKVTDVQIAALPRNLRDLATILQTGADPAAIRGALTELADHWPKDNATILDLVRKTTFSDEKFCRKKALLLLCQHDLTNSFPFVLARMDDSSFEIRWTAMEYIERSIDPRALKPLVERFTGPDRAKISLALMAYGTAAEPYLFEYLKNDRSEVRMETSLLLGKMGSEASIPKLEEVAENDTNPVVAMQAKSAIQKINERLAEDKK